MESEEEQREEERGRRKAEWEGGKEGEKIPTTGSFSKTLLLPLDNHCPEVVIFTALFYFILCSPMYSSPIFSAYF